MSMAVKTESGRQKAAFNLLLTAFSLLLMCGCRTLPIATDSSVIVKEYVRDTIVQYQLERELVECQVEITDTIYLDNKYSQAKAWVVGDKLHGRLQSRDTSVDVALKYPIKRVETMQTKIVEVNRLRWWQEALIWAGALCVLWLGINLVITKFVK